MKLVAGLLVHYAGTLKHKGWVALYLLRYAFGSALPRERWTLVWRALKHDLSKFRWDEARGFASTIFELKRTEYGTGHYRDLLHMIEPSIERHYERNDHHPEFYRPVGYLAMPWLQKIEMVADWAAAVRRHDNGDLERSIEINRDRFGYDWDEAGRLRRIAERMGAL